MRALLSLLALLYLSGAPIPFQTGRQAVRTGPDFNLPFSPAVKAERFIYLSGAIAMDDAGSFAGGDVTSQTRRVLDNSARLLKAADSRLENAVSVTVYLRRASEFPAVNEVYRTYWTNDPPARTTVIANLALPEALVEISIIAVRDGAERQVVHPAGWLKPPSPYCYGIRSGDTLFLSGLLSRNGRDNTPVPGDMKAQTKTVMENAGEVLKTGGMSFANVASARVYITDVSRFQDMNAEYRTFFPADPPARATLRTGLTSPDALVEIALVAVKDGARRAVNPPNPDGSPAQLNPNLSSAIRVGSRLFLSGLLGNDAGNRGDAAGQTRATLARITRILKLEGFDWQDVVDGTVYLTDVRNISAVNQAYREVFSGRFPARVAVETGLMSPDAMVEIMFFAQK